MRHASAACGLLPIQVRYVCAKVLEFQSSQRRLFAIERLISRRCYSKFTIYKNRACFESLLNQIHHEISWYIDWFLLMLDYLLTCRLMCKRCMHYCIPITVTVFVFVFVNVFFLVLFIRSDLFYQYYSKYMLLCSTEETKSYMFETM